MLANYSRSAIALSKLLEQEGVEDKQVLKAIADIPRHAFIDDVLKHKAYENTALPIGQGQTISQPYIVARMTELLHLAGVRDKVLEIGTGSGYQTAILSHLCQEVCTIEIHGKLINKAKKRIAKLNLKNIIFKLGDGAEGFQNKALFDAIIISAAMQESIPNQRVSEIIPAKL